jgi:solute carrier family 39 (zinc transporter), member 1/2/3
VSRGPSVTGPSPEQYTGCHAHDEDQYCLAPDGEEVLVLAAEAEDEHADHDHEDEHEDEHDEHGNGEEEEMDCHFHAGVEYVSRLHSCLQTY